MLPVLFLAAGDCSTTFRLQQCMYNDRGPATSLITRYSTTRVLVAFNKHVIPAGRDVGRSTKGVLVSPKTPLHPSHTPRRRRPTTFCAVGQSIFSQKLRINRRGHTGRRRRYNAPDETSSYYIILPTTQTDAFFPVLGPNDERIATHFINSVEINM